MESITTKSPLVQKAYDEIRNKISCLELFPGQIVSDHILSKDLNMSRTPIKQALLELRRDGLLVDVKSGKGYEVSKITSEEVEDLFDAREGLETMALKIAMRKGVLEADISELTALNESICEAHQAGKLRDVFNYDQKLHSKLVSLSENKRIIEFNETILLQLTRMRFLTFFHKTLPGIACNEHAGLIQAIRKGDSERATKILAEHIQSTKASYSSILARPTMSEDFAVLRFMMRDT